MASPSPAAYRVPFNRPSFEGPELDYIREAAESGRLSGDGGFTLKCQQILTEYLGAERVLLTTSCTHALELAAILLDLGPGDEVVVPSFAFPSMANAVILRGATPVFADIRPDTLNIDEARLAGLLTERTKAILLVHYAGVGCEMNAINPLAEGRGLAIIEDNAHGLFGSYAGRPLGSFGTFSTNSFHETKNFSCGEGGALAINNPDYVERAEIVREKGTNRTRFFRGQVDKYTWVDLGSSFLPSEILAAVLLGQLEARQRIQERRRAIWQRYLEALAGWVQSIEATPPAVPPGCDPAYHMFHMLMPSAASRDALIAHLRARGILAVFHYLPLHLSPMGETYGGRVGDCPVTEDITERLVRLPMFNSMTEADQDAVVEAVLDFR